jgi:hypothetical protein
MKRPFNCFVGIDWSGDKKKWQKGLKIAYARPGSSAPIVIAGPGLKGRWSRTEAVNWIVELVSKERALVGLDFAFSFPPSGIPLNWEYIEQLCSADANFYGGKFFQSPNTQHCHLVNSQSVKRDIPFVGYLRATEHASKLSAKGATPQSVFNAVGPAQVGPSSISGMRVLLHLRHNHGDKVSIWPFDALDDARSTIVEIFPRYFPLSRKLSPKLSDHAALNTALKAFGSAPVRMPPESEDEGDALLSAAALRSLCIDPTIFQVESVYAKTEGWIFGIPCNDDLFSTDLTSEQIAEIEQSLAVGDPIATEEEVKATFDLLSGSRSGPTKLRI